MTKENLKLWEQVCESDPNDLTSVNLGYEMTSANPHSVVKRATEIWGPIGEGWVYEVGMIKDVPDDVCIVQLSLRYKVDEKTWSHPVINFGSCAWKMGSKIDPEAPKKATTDALKKVLSYLGFNADIFEGQFNGKNLDIEKIKYNKRIIDDMLLEIGDPELTAKTTSYIGDCNDNKKLLIAVKKLKTIISEKGE